MLIVRVGLDSRFEEALPSLRAGSGQLAWSGARQHRCWEPGPPAELSAVILALRVPSTTGSRVSALVPFACSVWNEKASHQWKRDTP